MVLAAVEVAADAVDAIAVEVMVVVMVLVVLVISVAQVRRIALADHQLLLLLLLNKLKLGELFGGDPCPLHWCTHFRMRCNRPRLWLMVVVQPSLSYVGHQLLKVAVQLAVGRAQRRRGCRLPRTATGADQVLGEGPVPVQHRHQPQKVLLGEADELLLGLMLLMATTTTTSSFVRGIDLLAIGGGPDHHRGRHRGQRGRRGGGGDGSLQLAQLHLLLSKALVLTDI